MVQRKRLEPFFGYQHRFGAHLPAFKREFWLFPLPVLVGDEIVAVLDLKMDRAAGHLWIQNWIWIVRREGLQALIEAALDRFERFQMLDDLH